MTKYRRKFGTKEEFLYRKDIFLKRLREIEEHNAASHLSTCDVNHFTDMSDEEISNMLGYKSDSSI